MSESKDYWDSHKEQLSEFWEAQKGLMLIGSDGALRFTAAGRANYTALMAKHGFALETIRTQERFKEVMGVINSVEYEQNTRQFEELLRDPELTEQERSLINQILNRTPQAV